MRKSCACWARPRARRALKTPERVAKAMAFLTKGYDENPLDIIRSATFREENTSRWCSSRTSSSTRCANTTCCRSAGNVAYIPTVTKGWVFRKWPAWWMLARRLQVQERLTVQIRDCIQEALNPMGVAVVIEANHMCMQMRGIEKQRSATTTSASRASSCRASGTREGVHDPHFPPLPVNRGKLRKKSARREGADFRYSSTTVFRPAERPLRSAGFTTGSPGFYRNGSFIHVSDNEPEKCPARGTNLERQAGQQQVNCQTIHERPKKSVTLHSRSGREATFCSQKKPKKPTSGSTQDLVNTAHDTGTDFAAIDTYYIPDSILIIGNSDKTEYWKDADAMAIIGTVVGKLDDAGYTRTEDKDAASVGIQLSYVRKVTYFVGYDYPYWWWYYPYYWAPGYWGRLGGMALSLQRLLRDTAGSLLMEMLDLQADQESGKKLPIVWDSFIGGLLTSDADLNQQRTIAAVEQAFEQSPYLAK